MKWLPIGITLFSLVAFTFWKRQPTAESLDFLGEQPDKHHETKPKAELTPLALEKSPAEAVNEKERNARNAVTQRFGSGDYLTALTIADKQLLDPGLSPQYKAWLKKQMPAILSSVAWNLLQLGKCEDARAYFERSLDYEKASHALKGLGICAYRLKDWDTVVRNLESYLLSSPDDKAVRPLLAEGLESLGRFGEASAVLEGVLESTADAKRKQQIIQRIQSMQAKDREGDLQSRMSSQSFSITYRMGDSEELASQSLLALEKALQEFIAEWELPEVTSVIDVYLYPDETFSNTVSYGPDWATGLFDGKIRIRIPNDRRNDNLKAHERVLRHELFHALIGMRKRGGYKVPYWLNEGMAQFLECEGGCTQIRVPSGGVGRFLKKEAFSRPFTELNKNEAKVVYRQSLFMVQMFRLLSRHSDNPQALVLGEIVENQSDGEDFLKVAGFSFDDLYEAATAKWNDGK